MTPRTLNIRPSAKILKVLGDIEFEPWQCIAELVDNSFDDFMESRRSGQPLDVVPRVDVSVPLPGTPPAQGTVEVMDNGRGMDLDTLNNAVRAGWSSNDPFSKLGLFGMGFNIATARLGSVVRILSTREGDVEWSGVEIDVDSLRDDFEAPVISEEKADASVHGTRVIVSRLKPDRAIWLQRNAAHVRTTLGAVYSYLLDVEKFELWVSAVRVQPRRPCHWAEHRAVTYGSGPHAEQIPAVLRIDHALPSAEICMTCRNWQELPSPGECKECGGTNLVARERRIHGWLGIQRYLHKTDFGIDFLRNGRKILRQDKRLFTWKDPNDPMMATDVEYPVELGQGGRIIGEIHLDHVPVNYHKDAFEWNDRSWISAVNFLRGPGPLLPKRASALGYGDNSSFLGRLHRGYRRNDAGQRCLIPGDGTGPIHDKSREWAERFYEGDAEYQTDEKWWHAAVFHDQEKARRQAEERAGKAGNLPIPEPGHVRSALGISDGADESGDDVGEGTAEAGLSKDGVATPPESEHDRVVRYRSLGRLVPSLSGDFGLVEFARTVHLKVYELPSRTVVRDARNYETPVWLVAEKGDQFEAFINPSHQVFKDFSGDASEYVVLELANHLRTRANSDMPLAQVTALLKLRHLADLKVDQAVLTGRAQELLRTLREKMSDAVRANPERAWQFLTADERTAIEGSLVTEGLHTTLSSARDSGDFILVAPPLFLPRLFEEWPEAFLDGHVFQGPFGDVASASARRMSVGKVAGYLYDVARLVSAIQPMSKDELTRVRFSLQLLEAEMVGVP